MTDTKNNTDWLFNLLLDLYTEAYEAGQARTGTDQIVLKTKAAIQARLREEVVAAKESVWRDILGEDMKELKQFYPTDEFHDFITIPSWWINEQLLKLKGKG